MGGERETRSDPSVFGESKLLLSLWVEALQAKLRACPRSAHVTVVSVYPGSVATEMIKKVDTTAARARGACARRADVCAQTAATRPPTATLSDLPTRAYHD